MERVYYTKRKRRSRKRFLIICIFSIALILLIYFLTKTLFTKKTPTNVLGEEDLEIEVLQTPTPYPFENEITGSELLAQDVKNSMAGTKGSYGIVVKNLKTDEDFSLNKHILYSSASLYKLWVMAAAYEQIKNGKLKEDDVLSESIVALNKKFGIPQESAELKEGEIKLSVKDALFKMITISDNYAALLLTSKIRLATVTSFLKTNGFNESAVGTLNGVPTTTAHDISLFFEKLYNLQIIDKEYSEKMLQLLKAQRLNDKIPKNLPDNTIIAHKTGELDEYTHDAGIVYAKNNEYIIVILSKSNSPDLAEDRISNISEAVYNYFEDNK